MYVKESRDTDFERHVIGPTCVLDFYSEKANVLDLYFTGIHFELANDYEILRDTVPDYKFKETGITLDETTLMRDYKLVRNGVYTLTDGFIQKHPEKIANLDQLEDRSLQVPKTNMLFQKRQTSFLSFMENRIVAASGRYIYYNNKFWLFTEENDLLCPVEALIDYYCDVIKERYK